ncbi:MAG TPA: sigma-70 family RNA polymerase sigma factor, partial [Solirubrobacteraceae bacterium]|nr:sigma-70 family RNA polymerase sigma factor [Solirubrobacteraceae bacterium]
MELLDDKAPTILPVSDSASAATASQPFGGLAGRQFELLTPSSSRLSDETLMALVVRGDSHAFALLYRRHVSAALAVATQMCQRRAIAEEVVQEAFLSCWRSRRHFDPTRGSVRAWVLGIARNRAIDFLRQNIASEVSRDGDPPVEDILEASDHTDGEVRRREHKRELLAALDD